VSALSGGCCIGAMRPPGQDLQFIKMTSCSSLVGEQCQDSAVEFGGFAVRLVQGAVDSAEVCLVGAAAFDGLFPVANRVRRWRWRDRRRGRRWWLRFVGGLRVDAVDRAGAGGVAAGQVGHRVRGQRLGSIARCPRGSIGGSNGTSAMPVVRGRRLRHRCGDAPSTAGLRSIATARVRVAGEVSARCRARSHRTNAHGPHTTGSTSGRRVMTGLVAAMVATVSIDVAGGEGGDPPVRHPRLGQDQQGPVAAAEPAVDPAVGRQPPQRRIYPCRIQLLPYRPGRPATQHIPHLPGPLRRGHAGGPVGGVDRRQPAGERPRRRRAVAEKHQHRLRSRGQRGVAGDRAPIREQHPLRAPSGRACGGGAGVGQLVGWVAHGLQAELGDGVADQGCVFPGVGLQDGGVAVPGLPHDRVRIRALPERFGDEPGPE